ncbi:MAG: glycosyltransferase family 1 protein [Verrucomicrobia bacterium]|nr:glycosyltransferase family 1 protein [Verrucomicrobiota bacterium]
MARIVLATFGSLGDLHPVLALACELHRRGHRVEVATVSLYREKIAALGLVFHPLRPELMVVDPAIVRAIMDGPRGSERLLRRIMFPAVRDMYADLARLIAGADLLVTSELVYAAPLLAAQGRVRWASFALAPLSYFSLHDPPIVPVAFGAGWLRQLPPRGVLTLLALARLTSHGWWRPLRRLRHDLGLPPGGNPLFEGKFSPLLDLALFSPAFARPQPDWPASTTQCGFCFHDEDSTAPALPLPIEQFLAAGAEPVVFTLGSAAVYAAGDFYPESIRAALALGRRALLLVGQNPPPPDLPPDVMAWDYLPYARIFPRAAALVHQGGIGTTAQALRAGRPMLVVPWAHDQPDNASRTVRLGVARTIARSRYRSGRVARELAVLLKEPAIVTRANAIAARLAAENGPHLACDAIERALTSRTPAAPPRAPSSPSTS